MVRKSTARKPTKVDDFFSRFQKVSKLYPVLVDQAYGGYDGLEAAMGDTDEQVASRVHAWEIAQGREPQNWVAIGREERRARAEELLEKWRPDGQSNQQQLDARPEP